MTPDRAAALQQAVGIAPGTFSERLAATGPDARAVYGALLPAFAASGRPPVWTRWPPARGLHTTE